MTDTVHCPPRSSRILVAAMCTVLAAFSGRLWAQAPAPRDSSPPPAARPSDVSSIDAILRAAYDVISGPAGPRDWQRFRSLFVTGARLIPAERDSTGHTRLQVTTVDEFAQSAAQYFTTNSFYERGIGQKVDAFGAVAQVFSSYASFRGANDPQPFARGINSFQLFNDGTRWYIVTIYWNAERPDLKIPAQYLNAK